MKEISLIGSTGSIGRQCLEVLRRNRDRFTVSAMVAGSNSALFLEQVNEFRPKLAVLVDETEGEKIRRDIPRGTRFAVGKEAASDAVSLGDTAFISCSGFSGLGYTLRALRERKNIALANKESLVCGGELVIRSAEKNGVDIIPVDSEHSAIWQALGFSRNGDFKRLIITASGGPFYYYTHDMLEGVTVKDALNHPTWSMGDKITVDSATLLNKGFEVMEAKWLYGCSPSKIETVVQPTSIIHSMVEFNDGAIIAQMSYPSMEIPIQLALTYPERIETSVRSIDFLSLGEIKFLPLERKRFPCYDLALSTMEAGGNMPCALNAAGEVAVSAFLSGRIKFTDISTVIEEALSRTEIFSVDDFETLKFTDSATRDIALKIISKKR